MIKHQPNKFEYFKKNEDSNQFQYYLIICFGIKHYYSYMFCRIQRTSCSGKLTFNRRQMASYYLQLSSKLSFKGSLQVKRRRFERTFHWRFEMNFWQTTLYWCNFNSLNGHVSFEVFWPENSHWLSERCNVKNCI